MVTVRRGGCNSANRKDTGILILVRITVDDKEDQEMKARIAQGKRKYGTDKI